MEFYEFSIYKHSMYFFLSVLSLSLTTSKVKTHFFSFFFFSSLFHLFIVIVLDFNPKGHSYERVPCGLGSSEYGDEKEMQS